MYSGMNGEELAFAKGLDSSGLLWHRNSVSGGFWIPLLSPGDTARFYPDFLVWKKNMVFALDTKGKHLLTEALARKMFDIYEGKTIRLHVRFVVKGRQEQIGGRTMSKAGYTVWRTKANAPHLVYSDTIADAVAECFR
jgi:type III restriction enzyme